MTTTNDERYPSAWLLCSERVATCDYYNYLTIRFSIFNALQMFPHVEGFCTKTRYVEAYLTRNFVDLCYYHQLMTALGRMAIPTRRDKPLEGVKGSLLRIDIPALRIRTLNLGFRLRDRCWRRWGSQGHT